ncbi:MAG: ATP-dependent zinc metalloprotease FtsH [Robiginitomaculum sp.]|nr:ATP-dependent zinc metalloprotease FtsH [Robiginitomaculum sp.]
MAMRNLLLWAIIILLVVSLFSMVQGTSNTKPITNEISFSTLMREAEAGQVSTVNLNGMKLSGTYANGETFISTTTFPDTALVSQLSAAGVDVTVKEESRSVLFTILMNFLPILLLIGFWLFYMRQMQGGGKGGAMGFGKSKAKLLTERQGKVMFSDVAGIDEAKEELEEIVEFLKDPSKFQRLGGKIPRGALLVGPPGTGKTLLARAIAGEAGVPFFSISGSDFVEMFVGVGASRVRDMFEQAKKNAPCIIFIDEIDAVGRSRGAGLGGGNDEREQTLNQLLVEMDGFETNEGIILIAATNRPDVLDTALLRPGRFDRQVTVPNPDILGREKILKIHTKDIPTAADVDVRVIARGTPGFSGADLANLCNEAALLAARREKRIVTMIDFEDAKDKVMMGAERRSMVMSEKEKRMTAYHEAGHAVVAMKVPAADPVHKATIIPRGRALGMVMQLPEDDKYSQSFEEMTSRLAILMGGRVAEELAFGAKNVTSGASSDIQVATGLAKAMVTKWGFSEKLGNISYGDDGGEVFLGQQLMRSSSISPETAKLIEEETKRFVDEGEVAARAILTKHKKAWKAVAEGLIEFETLTGEEIEGLIKGKRPNRPDPEETPKPKGPGAAVPVTSGGKKPKPKPKAGKKDGPEPQGA